jgi:3-dehydroquinate synthase
VRVGDGALSEAASELADWQAGRTVFVITSPKVWALHGDAVEGVLEPAAKWCRIEVAEGEAAKNLAHAERLWDQMLDAEGKRDSRIIAVGGGSVGDLAGFVAGCFLRGIEFAQFPTTMLAQVDASIGGKTAVNLPLAKNSVGLFYHPKWVVAETRFLTTLPAPELRSGLIEVIKAGVALDSHLFERLEENLDSLFSGDTSALAPVVAEAMGAKIAVVEKDPTEQGGRRLLNLGHTLGHALESQLGYRGLRHGEAVGFGILFALRLARKRGLSEADGDRIQHLVRRCDLPILPNLDHGHRRGAEALSGGRILTHLVS